MKRHTTQALREMSLSQLQTEVDSLVSELGKAKIEHAVGKLSNPALLKMVRKEIARIKSIMSEKELTV